jgi:rubrerythrin
MTKTRDPKIIGDYLHCLSMLENNTSLLYQNLADKTEIPLAKALLLSIAEDSSKHSTLFKCIADTIAPSKNKAKDCAKRLGKTWRIVNTFLQEITNKEKMNKIELEQMIERLEILESSAGEEYYIFVQMKTLQYMVKEIRQLYNISLERTRNLFTSIIEDEEHHRELLATIKDLLSENEPHRQDNTPRIKYQNPDSWIQQLPPNNP